LVEMKIGVPPRIFFLLPFPPSSLIFAAPSPPDPLHRKIREDGAKEEIVFGSTLPPSPLSFSPAPLNERDKEEKIAEEGIAAVTKNPQKNPPQKPPPPY